MYLFKIIGKYYVETYQGRLPPTSETFYIPKNLIEDSNFSRMISWDTVNYLGTSLDVAMPDVACPVITTGDGNCLLHALSRTLYGVEIYQGVLREMLCEELVTHKEFYMNSASKDHEDEDGYEEEEYQVFIENARRGGSYLGFIHIFALANITRRPIIVYASERDTAMFGMNEQGAAGTFLPTRIGIENCITCTPLVICWANETKNHFVAMIPVENESFSWPQLDVVYQKTLETSPDEYINYCPEVNYSKINTIIEKHKQQFEMREQVFARQIEMLKEERRKSISLMGKESQGNATYFLNRATGELYSVSKPRPDYEKYVDKHTQSELYDLIIRISAGGIENKIGYNLDEKPYDVAKNWLKERRDLSNSHLKVIEDFITRKADKARRKYPMGIVKKSLFKLDPEREEAIKKAVPSRKPTQVSDVIPYNGKYKTEVRVTNVNRLVVN
eukprot:TRINITY_DN6690_c0_g1_i2.p1 TRINITY_DN6690_c0_g1~~TRINITY_DN6690_c0_g1_i2.p1  ORF type:complete len:446 (-),score=84.89 TRINITY_DN6690_c0_g1_i2:57-1394(-)